MSANVKLAADTSAVMGAATSSAGTEGSSRSTSKTLSTLLLASNKLRQTSEAACAGLEPVPRTKALEHALVNKSPSSSAVKSPARAVKRAFDGARV